MMLKLSPAEWEAMLLSLKVAGVAVAIGLAAWRSLPLGCLSRKSFYGKWLIEGLIHLPLVLPPGRAWVRACCLRSGGTASIGGFLRDCCGTHGRLHLGGGGDCGWR